MTESLHLPLILLAAFMATASPGPATLAIAGTSLSSGRHAGLAVALGVATGSLSWSLAAAFGLAALMAASVTLFEVLRYAGAAYLGFLAYKAARAAMKKGEPASRALAAASTRRLYIKGLMLHLTNPKAIFFFAALYSVGVPAQAGAATLAEVIIAVGLQSTAVFVTYAMLFSLSGVARLYRRLNRVFEACFAAVFGLAAIKVLTTRLG
ncbi:LysE family translocator [Martelella sp. HB161492]|uniref:LysE family translocator n=1 Tax=Martelella sp. HB161492 TaxID=2720726 RepID=UPI0015913CB2|nr:LysE family translocator [Martelella sp. HB161492]